MKNNPSAKKGPLSQKRYKAGKKSPLGHRLRAQSWASDGGRGQKKDSGAPGLRLSPAARAVIKWAFYALLALFLYAASTSGPPQSSRALLLLPLGCALALYSGEIHSAAAGLVIGVLIDMSLGQLIGFTSFYLCFAFGIGSALFRQFFRKNIINFLIYTLALCMAYYYLVYFFYYRIWDFEGYEEIIRLRLLPSFIKTMLISPLIFLAVRLAERLSRGHKTLDIEQQDEKIDRV